MSSGGAADPGRNEGTAGATTRWIEIFVAAVLALAAGVLTVIFFLRIPIAGTTLALDWIGIRAGVTGWNLAYGAESALRIPPWSALLLVPMGMLPVQAGWGVVAFLTLAIVTLSLPWNRLKRGGIPVVCFLARPWLPGRTHDRRRQHRVPDPCGFVLLEVGILRRQPLFLALGVLLAATKVQETWILLIAHPLLLGRVGPAKCWRQPVLRV